jgi:hypothetical protein
MRLTRKKAITSMVGAAAIFLAACGGGEEVLAPVSDVSETTTSTTAPPEVGDVVVNPESMCEGFEDCGDVNPSTELAFNEDAEAAMEGADQERGSAAHSDETLTTVEELTTALNDASNPDMVPVRERVVAAITEVCGEADVSVHLEQNEGWLLMVVRPESQIKGISYMTESGLQIATNWRQVGENDAYWLPVCTQGENKGDVAWGGVVRADCGNAHDTPKIRINRPDTPEVPPVETPPGEKCPFNPDLPVDSPNCLKPKDPTQDVNVNPNVPPQVTGPGTTPVGTDPGPSTPACDTPTGYCPGSEPTTPTTAPSGGSGGGGSGGGSTPTTVPGCGQAGQPSCGNTGVTPPTTVAPPAPPPTQPPQDGEPESP